MPFNPDVSFENTTGRCIIFSAPSGAGKTTIVHHLLKQDLDLEFSVSACSRDMRPNEVDGEDYYFLGIEEFKKRITENAFIEYEEVYPDHFYGTLKSEIERIWKKGKHVIFDVDVVGGLNLKKIFGSRALAIFVMPPSIEDLEGRLRNRKTETEDRIRTRVAKAREEIKTASEFDVILENRKLDTALNEAEKLVENFLKIESC